MLVPYIYGLVALLDSTIKASSNQYFNNVYMYPLLLSGCRRGLNLSKIYKLRMTPMRTYLAYLTTPSRIMKCDSSPRPPYKYKSFIGIETEMWYSGQAIKIRTHLFWQ